MISYTFVLTWHGFEHQYFVWVAFSLIEIMAENVAKMIYGARLKPYQQRYLSDTKFRRILAWLQIYAITLGLFGVFYFLGGSKSGWVFVDRIIFEETIHLRWPIFLLLFIGFCFANMCMDVQRWEEGKRKKGEKNE